MDKSKLFVAAALALTSAFGAGVAQARTPELQWSITIGSPVVIAPAPVYVRPWPVYTPPSKVRVQPVPVHPRSHWRPTRWDHDGDGIPNRHDRLYNPRWDRDGDGIANRHDRHDRHDRNDRRRWQGR